MTLEQTAGGLFSAGVQAHKAGDLRLAEELYQEALQRYGQGSGAGLSDADAAELLHLLGALKVQQLVGSDDDDDAAATGSAAEALPAALALLRKALLLLPREAAAAQRARLQCSLGTALLHAPERCPAAGLGRSRGASVEEALDLLRDACKLHEDRWAAWYNCSRALSLLLQEREDSKSASEDELKALEEEKLTALRTALRLKPRHPGCLYRLGMSLRERGDHHEASKALADFLALDAAGSAKRQAGARHWLAVLRGETTATAPAEYVAGLFDGYAERFDQHLVETLEYRTPQLLAEELEQVKAVIATELSDADQPVLFQRCADLGCGTGLMGPLLKDLGVQQLEGVDLSSKMLQVAREKQRGYDVLLCADLVEIFDETKNFDLVVAADVFVYLGDLSSVLQASAARLARHGVVAFSTEAPPRRGGANEDEGQLAEGTFKLAETGRYIHTASYVRQCAEHCGLKLWKRRNVVLRKNGGKPVYGQLHVLRKM